MSTHQQQVDLKALLPETSSPLAIFDRLHAHFGPQHWWPADSPFEVIVGAVLTQNTAWRNVEKAIVRLKENSVLNISAMMKIPEAQLAALIRSSGFYRLKAQRLKAVLQFIFQTYAGQLHEMFKTEGKVLRKKLLFIKGLGPETVDAILLYAGEMPFFVVDAYTRRIFSRHGILDEKQHYQQIQDYFMKNLENETKLFNEYHALIVQTAKSYCHKKMPNCASCPLGRLPGFEPIL